MPQTRHTMGPWIAYSPRWIDGLSSFKCIVHYTQSEKYRAPACAYGETEEQAKANAALIAAAPEMLDALKYVLGVFESLPEYIAEQVADHLDEAIDTARLENIINQATGRDK